MRNFNGKRRHPGTWWRRSFGSSRRKMGTAPQRFMWPRHRLSI